MPPKRTATAKKVQKATKASNFNSQYISLYKEYAAKYGPKVAVLYQIGGFFEMYDLVSTQTEKSQANVLEVVEYLGRYVEPKPTTDPEWSHVFWGFPENSLNLYERRLVEGNYTVVVFAQVTDTFGNVTGRELKYILSPGTYLDMEVQAAQKPLQDTNIIGIHIDVFSEKGKPKWYMASSAFTIATGKATSTEDAVAIVDGKPVLDAFAPFWSVFTPAEVVVWSRISLSEDQIRSWFPGFQGLIHMYEIPADANTAAASRGRQEFLHRLYTPDCSLSIAEYLGLEMYHHAFLCLAMLLQFVKDHTPSYLENLHDHTFWTPENELLLGNSALQQLAMLSTGKDSECLLHWIQRAYTAGGKRFLRERCLKPITDVDELYRRQERIQELRLNRSASLDSAFKGIFDVARLHRKCRLGKVTAMDLQQLLLSYKKIHILLELMSGSLSKAEEESKFQTILKTFQEHWSLERIRMCGTEHCHGVGPAHPWSRGIHADLDEKEDEWMSLVQRVSEIKEGWEALIGEEDCLKLEWRNDAPFTLHTTKRRATGIQTVAKQRKMPAVSVQTKGSSSIVILQTEELQELNIKAITVWSAWTEAVKEKWESEWRLWEPVEEIVEWVSQLDAEYALARVAEEYGYVKPTYQQNAGMSGVRIVGMRHPIIERVNPAVPYIPHSLTLGCLASDRPEDIESAAAVAGHGILLYGVNAAGKSSLSKALGLCVLLAQCGIPVPAKEMTLVPYRALFTRILGNDNLWAGMSSFVVEMTEFRSILRGAGPHTLVLGDELCAGTETVSATAIVAAGIQTLTEKRTQFVFATHLHELMEMSEIAELPLVKAFHLTVQADVRPGGKLIYDRQLKPGSGSAMYGLEVCRGLDMDTGFLTKAIQIRKRLETIPSMSKVSRYNAAVPIQACSICEAKDGLETHHIVPQAEANQAGFVDVGKHKNDVGNLVILCESCHFKHHSGTLIIHGWVQTTGGRKLDISRLE